MDSLITAGNSAFQTGAGSASEFSLTKSGRPCLRMCCRRSLRRRHSGAFLASPCCAARANNACQELHIGGHPCVSKQHAAPVASASLRTSEHFSAAPYTGYADASRPHETAGSSSSSSKGCGIIISSTLAI